jgi:3-phosphoglycerate kinase
MLLFCKKNWPACDIYVNDAFELLIELQLQSLLNIPTGKCFGLLAKEIDSLNKVLKIAKDR